MPAASVRLVPGYCRALAALADRHPGSEVEVSTFRDRASVGWCCATFTHRRGRGNHANPWTETAYLMSPTGRAWRVPDGADPAEYEAGWDLVRDADYGEAA